MRFEVLSLDHIPALFQFEQLNKEWFESLIEPRVEAFYSPDGIATHISDYLEAAKQRRSYSVLLLEGSEVLARGNLKAISGHTAQVGYRVAENHGSKGLAGMCLSHLISEAKNTYKLNELQARVLENNPASLRVLQKQGFVQFESLPGFVDIQGKSLDCVGLRKTLL
ncbi:GNAT family N-acetyltransferase [Pseudoteredinibacter isoporae]|uniref:GNAT family N-acetyltransferase n=1 Tax=Pseudoteredinibacter isoporae TaxID=570281 RepID=UPI003103DB82